MLDVLFASGREAALLYGAVGTVHMATKAAKYVIDSPTPCQPVSSCA